ncbi:MAG: M4 family metallopeptidase, partial [Bacteroidota bacterium]
YDQVVVFDGHLSLHFDADERLQSVSAVVLPDLNLNTTPTLTEQQARQRAQQWLAKQYPTAPLGAFHFESDGLVIIQPKAASGKAAEPRLTYQLLVDNQQHIRELLFIDAQSGTIVTHYSENCHALTREQHLHHLNNPIWTEGSQFPGELDQSQQQQLVSTEHVYDFFRLTFNRLSYDNADATFRIVDQAHTMHACPNAMWNGHCTSYCTGMSTDDVVAHEWGHAYTEHTSHLLYAWQAGAINEAYSDIWGELIDQLNGDDDLGLRLNCDNSQRWKIGEDAPALGGAVRDMFDPNCNGHPAKVSDPFYHCESSDNGGVHRNSGVINHAFALLVDGGSFNQQDIPAIGLTKAAHLFWHANTYYLSRTSDFRALADALLASVTDLRNVDLPILALDPTQAGLSGKWIGAVDSLAVARVIAATELRLVPDFCETYRAVLSPDTPDWCNTQGLGFAPFYTADFESTTDTWTTSEVIESPESWVARSWVATTDLPDGRTGRAMYGVSPVAGDCDDHPNNGLLRLDSPQIPISEDLSGNIYLTFDHYFSLERGFDGGLVRVQQNDGHWQNLPIHAFIRNGYNALLNFSFQSDNPLAGQRAFSGANSGSVVGSWGTTQINLSVIGVTPGDAIRIRWELGTDGCDGWDGWYVDNVHLGTCAEAALFPVEWLDFTAAPKPKHNLLVWSTATETNNAGFAVERSTDGRFFQEIAWVTGAGNSQTEQHYVYEDTEYPAHLANLYYRLRQEDVTGSNSYSPIQQVTRKLDGQDWLTYPNPATDQLKIHWQGDAEQEVQLTVYNSQNQQMGPTTSWTTTKETLTLDVSRWPDGVYNIHLISANGDHSVQRVVVRS